MLSIVKEFIVYLLIFSLLPQLSAIPHISAGIRSLTEEVRQADAAEETSQEEQLQAVLNAAITPGNEPESTSQEIAEVVSLEQEKQHAQDKQLEEVLEETQKKISTEQKSELAEIVAPEQEKHHAQDKQLEEEREDAQKKIGSEQKHENAKSVSPEQQKIHEQEKHLGDEPVEDAPTKKMITEQIHDIPEKVSPEQEKHHGQEKHSSEQPDEDTSKRTTTNSELKHITSAADHSLFEAYTESIIGPHARPVRAVPLPVMTTLIAESKQSSEKDDSTTKKTSSMIEAEPPQEVDANDLFAVAVEELKPLHLSKAETEALAAKVLEEVEEEEAAAPLDQDTKRVVKKIVREPQVRPLESHTSKQSAPAATPTKQDSEEVQTIPEAGAQTSKQTLQQATTPKEKDETQLLKTHSEESKPVPEAETKTSKQTLQQATKPKEADETQLLKTHVEESKPVPEAETQTSKQTLQQATKPKEKDETQPVKTLSEESQPVHEAETQTLKQTLQQATTPKETSPESNLNTTPILHAQKATKADLAAIENNKKPASPSQNSQNVEPSTVLKVQQLNSQDNAAVANVQENKAQAIPPPNSQKVEPLRSPQEQKPAPQDNDAATTPQENNKVAAIASHNSQNIKPSPSPHNSQNIKPTPSPQVQKPTLEDKDTATNPQENTKAPALRPHNSQNIKPSPSPTPTPSPQAQKPTLEDEKKTPAVSNSDTKNIRDQHPSSSDAPPPKTSQLQGFKATICGPEDQLIKCSSGTSIVTFMSTWGRASPETCPSKTPTDTTCEHTITSAVAEKCDKASVCQLGPSVVKGMDDPCPDISKYITVVFRCVAAESKIESHPTKPPAPKKAESTKGEESSIRSVTSTHKNPATPSESITQVSSSLQSQQGRRFEILMYSGTGVLVLLFLVGAALCRRGSSQRSYAGKYGRYAPLKKEEEFDNPFAAALENHEGVELMRK